MEVDSDTGDGVPMFLYVFRIISRFGVRHGLVYGKLGLTPKRLIKSVAVQLIGVLH